MGCASICEEKNYLQAIKLFMNQQLGSMCKLIYVHYDFIELTYTNAMDTCNFLSIYLLKCYIVRNYPAQCDSILKA